MLNSDRGDSGSGGGRLQGRLAEMIGNRRWVKCLEPFPHVRAENVFCPEVYGELAAQFKAVLSLGLSETPDFRRLSRASESFDAYTLDLQLETAGALRVFFSTDWNDMLSRLFDIQVTGDVICSMHHHVTRSRNGHVHNDLNPGWFPDTSRTASAPQSEKCNYKTGGTGRQAAPTRETIRAVSLIYYLNNHNWKVGDGGETGLYDSLYADVNCPKISIPPINNSLLAFECTPFTYHSFIKNRRHTRNSIIMWLHRPKSEAILEWGEKSIVYWFTPVVQPAR
jgi:hypothetical protein